MWKQLLCLKSRIETELGRKTKHRNLYIHSQKSMECLILLDNYQISLFEPMKQQYTIAKILHHQIFE